MSRFREQYMNMGVWELSQEHDAILAELAKRGVDTPRPEAGEFKWALVPKDVPLGAFPACSPGTPMYAIDERDVPLNTPFRVWKIDMPPLPPLPQRDER